jgi:benzoyl-CoA reductase subunit C
MVLPVEEHTVLVREYLAAAELLPRPKRDNARVVLTGGFCEQPPLALIKSIEMSGCYIVDDDFMLVTRWLLDEVPADGSPLLELSQAPSCTARPRPRRSTTPRARRRACSSSSRSRPAAPRA